MRTKGRPKTESCHDKRTLLPHEIPYRPWKKVGTDLFAIEFNSIGFRQAADTKSTSEDLKLKNHFTHRDIRIKRSLTMEQGKFRLDMKFQHTISSLGQSESSREVKSALSTAKRFLRKSSETGTDHNHLLLFSTTGTLEHNWIQPGPDRS